MAKNTGRGHRTGAVVGRTQVRSGSGHYVKRDTTTGRFLDVKSDGTKWKGVTTER
jgi:hypothetical protein